MKWADYWQFVFHPDICVTMSTNRKESSNITYRMNEVKLKQVQNGKDIGITVNHQLKL